MIYGKVNTRQSSQPFSIPAPVGGLNGRDPLASMPAIDAYLMDNAFPDTSKVTSRRGHEKFNPDHVLAGPVQTLDVYAGADGDQMLAWAGGKIYDASLSVPVELATGMVSSIAINAMFSNAADDAQHLISVTGFDTPKHYDGSAISNLVITGPTNPNELNYVFAFKERLYFGERDKLGFWFLPVGAIQGAASYFDLAQVSRNGGYLRAIATYSEGGETPQDYIVFITSKGECITYMGYDPSSAANWQLVGRYFAATPIGPRCTLNYNGELVILTLEGALTFSSIRKGGDSSNGVNGSQYTAITSKLGRFLSDFNANADVHGWQGVQYPRSGMLILNVPASSSIAGAYYHYVMNTTTNAWCRFTGWDGICFTVFNSRLYFGTYEGFVMLGDEGRDDNGESIRVDLKQSYNYFSDERSLGPLQKHFQWASLLVACDGQPPLSGKFNVDFNEEQPDFLNTLAETDGSEWDVTSWDVGTWGFDLETQKFIITLNKQGYAGSLWLRASMQGLTLDWFATQYVMQKTQGLLI